MNGGTRFTIAAIVALLSSVALSSEPVSAKAVQTGTTINALPAPTVPRALSGAARPTASIVDCAVVITGIGVGYATGGAGWAVWAALSSAAAQTRGCGGWMASAICRGTWFWGPAGWPFRQAVKAVTRGRYSRC